MKTKIIFLMIICSSIPLSAQYSELVFNEKETGKLVSPEMLNNHMISLMNQYNISGMSAAIVKGGKTVWKSSYGYSNRETSSLVNDSTSFLLYSVTKTFTGIGLMQLYENGYFDLDDNINDYLPFDVIHPDYPSDTITIRMLMNHTSGIKDNFTVINSLISYNNDTELELSNVLENYLVEGGTYYGENTSYTNSHPGTSFSYSNIGASLGGYLIECISGIDYKQYVTDSILIPAGMTNSFFKMSECDPGNMAMEYSYTNPNYNCVGIVCSPFFPAGFLRSDINDMSEYLKMLLNGGSVGDNSIISTDMLNMMMTEDNPMVAPNSGLFFGYDPDNGLWGHNGGFNGVKTGLFMDREEDWGVVVLSNGAGEPWQILFMLYQYAKDFEIFNVTNASVVDDDDDFVIEPEEKVNISIRLRNNSDFDFENISVEMTSTSNMLSFTDSIDEISVLNSGETLSLPLFFEFLTKNFSESFDVQFMLHFFSEGLLVDTSTFNLYFGNADILLINDEEHVYRNRNKSAIFFKESIISAGKSVREHDINQFGLPPTDGLFKFGSVIWFTGLDNEMIHTVMEENEQMLISGYLDGGGKLFLSSQNASDALSETTFFNDYLKSVQTNPDYTGMLRLSGIDTVLISSGLDFYISGGDGTNTQYSPSSISPVNGSGLLFNYYGTQNGAGIYYNGDYKLVFLPFCFSSIDNQDDRDGLMNRILSFFDGLTGLNNGYFDDALSVYPNPARDILQITNTKGKGIIRVYSIDGKLFYSELMTAPKEVNISKLSSGIYVIVFTSENGQTSMQKFVKE